MRNLDQILTDYRQTAKDVETETIQRAEIMQSEEYRSLQEKIDASLAFQKEMLKGLPDSREEFLLDKKELMEYMQSNQVGSAGEFKAKTRTVRTVDTRKVLEAMQGDIDNMMLVASVKIKDLDEFAKANPEYGKDLRSCIIEEGFTVVDITSIPQS